MVEEIKVSKRMIYGKLVDVEVKVGLVLVVDMPSKFNFIDSNEVLGIF